MERKLNEVFKHKKTELKVVECESCEGCFYASNLKINNYCNDITFFAGICDQEYRTDKKSVIFIKQ